MAFRFAFGMILGLAALVAGCAREKAADEFHLTGRFEGGGGTMLYLEKLEGEKTTLMDSVKMDADGKFEFWGKMNGGEGSNGENTVAVIHTADDKNILLLPGNSELEIQGVFSDFQHARVAGNAVNEVLNRYRIRQLDLFMAFVGAKEATRKLNRHDDFEAWRSAEAGADEAYLAYQEFIREFTDTVRFPVIRAAAAMAVLGKDDFYFLDIVTKRVVGELPGHPLTAALQKRVQERETEWKGMQMPFFVSSDLNGKQVSTDELKGKRVLFYVWASYCRRSRIENARLKAFYEKQPSSELILVSYSLDDDPQAWKNAVIEDGLPGEHHWISSDSWNCPPVNLMGVQAIPMSYLIDAEGKIQTTGLFGNDLITDWGSL